MRQALARDTHYSNSSPTYAEGLRAELRILWRNILLKHAPHVATWAEATPLAPIRTGPDATPYLQALSIWFPLLRIVDENADVRIRRLVETNNGAEAVEVKAEVAELCARFPIYPNL